SALGAPGRSAFPLDRVPDACARTAALTEIAPPDVPVAINQTAAAAATAIPSTRNGQRSRLVALPADSGGAAGPLAPPTFSPGSSRTRHTSDTECTSIEPAGGWGLRDDGVRPLGALPT